MAPVGSRFRAIAAAAALLGVGVPPALPQPARAADESVVPLPGATSAAVRADLDGDGALDLARLVEAPGEPQALEVWGEGAETGWSRAASLEVPWPANGDVDASNATMGTALLVARIGGAPSVLLVTTLVDPGSDAAETCCLTVHQVRLDGDRLALATHTIAGASGHEVQVLDFDGDGTDELLTIATQGGFDPAEPPTSTLSVFGWDDETLTLLAERERTGFALGAVVGELDGLYGAELVSALDDARRLERLAWDGVRLVFTEARAPTNPSGPGWPAGVLDEHLVYVDADGISLLAWPAHGEPTSVRRLATPEFPGAHVVGTGDASLLVVQGGSNPFAAPDETIIYDESLDRLGAVPVPEAVAEARVLLPEIPWDGFSVPHLALRGFSGPLPASGRQAAGWVSPAGVVRPDGSDGWRLEPMAALLGMPVGLLGAEDGWLAICESCWNSESQAVVFASGTFGHSALVVVRADSLAPGADAPMEATYAGAIAEGVDGHVTTLLARPSGATIEVPIPQGSRVVSSVDGTASDHGLADASFRLEVPGGGVSGRRDRWGATVLVIAPDTSFRIHRWEATYASASGPAVTAVVEPVLFELAATIAGRVEPGTGIRVDGEPVPVDAEGGFVHTVWASPWPQTVTVTAVDPFGTERTVHMEAVGFVDPRGLPWVAIVATLTLAFGALLFLRVPRGSGVTAPDGDGHLEELDGDAA